MSNKFESVKMVRLTAGKQGVAGAPMLTMVLMIDDKTGSVHGKGEITQAIAPPDGQQAVSNITGNCRAMGYGQATRSLTLTGEIFTTLKPPAIGTITGPFSAMFVTDNDWVGKGQFDYAMHKVDDVPIAPTA